MKNDRPRLLTVADGVLDLLKKQKAWQNEMKELLGEVWQNPDNLVFTDEFGKYLINGTVYSRYKRLLKRIGLGDKTFHAMRHTYAVNSLKVGDDVKTVQENLGHHSAAFTLNTYVHYTSGMRKESARRMDSFMKSIEE